MWTSLTSCSHEDKMIVPTPHTIPQSGPPVLCIESLTTPGTPHNCSSVTISADDRTLQHLFKLKNLHTSSSIVAATFSGVSQFHPSPRPLTPGLPLQACQTSQEKPWWNCTAPNVWTSTHPSPPGTTTQMEPILVLASPTCSSWFTLSTGQRGPPISLSQG